MGIRDPSPGGRSGVHGERFPARCLLWDTNRVRQILTANDFDDWLLRLRDRVGRAEILTRIGRLGHGNPGVVKSVGEGVREMKIDFGPGDRIYFVERADGSIVVLCAAATRIRSHATLRGRKRSRRQSEEGVMTDPDRPAEGLAKEPARTPTKPFDPAHDIRTPEDAAAYLTKVLEDGDEAEFRRALGAIARSRSMAEVAERAGLGRESLYKALSETGNPGLSTVLGVLRALDLRMTVAVVRTRPEAA